MSALTMLNLLSLSFAVVLCTVTDLHEMDKGNLTGMILDKSADLLHMGVSCDTYWSSFNRRFYRYFSTQETWAAAELYCVSLGANLVSIHSQEESNFIQALIKKTDPGQANTWIGLNDVHLEDHWMWSDGSKVDFTYWHEWQPDNENGTDNCVHTNYLGDKWNDNPCSLDYGFVCASRVV